MLSYRKVLRSSNVCSTCSFLVRRLSTRIGIDACPDDTAAYNTGSNESLPSVLLMPIVRNKKPTDLEGPSNILCSEYHELSTLAKAILV